MAVSTRRVNFPSALKSCSVIRPHTGIGPKMRSLWIPFMERLSANGNTFYRSDVYTFTQFSSSSSPNISTKVPRCICVEFCNFVFAATAHLCNIARIYATTSFVQAAAHVPSLLYFSEHVPPKSTPQLAFVDAYQDARICTHIERTLTRRSILCTRIFSVHFRTKARRTQGFLNNDDLEIT